MSEKIDWESIDRKLNKVWFVLAFSLAFISIVTIILTGFVLAYFVFVEPNEAWWEWLLDAFLAYLVISFSLSVYSDIQDLQPGGED